MTAAVLVCAAAIGSTAYASGGQRRGAIGSRGRIIYDNDQVIMDSADLITLADEMDGIEAAFKSCIADALAQIETYVQPDGSISHNNKADIDPRRIAFGDLVAGILQSQSVAHLARTQGRNEKGLIYYKFATNNLLEVTENDTGMPVLIVPATEENLTTQTAAWTNGHCLIGNGSDNYYFYQKGFIEGYAEKMGASVEYRYDDTGRIESAELVFP